jgi:hypothetical protein
MYFFVSWFSYLILIGLYLQNSENTFRNNGLLPTTDPTHISTELSDPMLRANQSELSTIFLHSEVVQRNYFSGEYDRYVDLLCLESVDLKTTKHLGGRGDIILEAISKNSRIFSDANFEKYWTFYGCMKHRLSLYIYILNRFLEVRYIYSVKENKREMDNIDTRGPILHTKETLLYSTIENIGRQKLSLNHSQIDDNNNTFFHVRLMVLDMLHEYRSDWSLFDEAPTSFLTRFINDTSDTNIYKNESNFVLELDENFEIRRRSTFSMVKLFERPRGGVMFSNRTNTEILLHYIFQLNPELKILWQSFYVQPTPVVYSHYKRYSKYWTFFNHNKFIIDQIVSKVYQPLVSFVPFDFILENLENLLNSICLKFYVPTYPYIYKVAHIFQFIPIHIFQFVRFTIDPSLWSSDHLLKGFVPVFQFIVSQDELYTQHQNCSKNELPDDCPTKNQYNTLTIFSYLGLDKLYSCATLINHDITTKMYICKDLEMGLVFFNSTVNSLIWLFLFAVLLLPGRLVLASVGFALLGYCILTCLFMYPKFNLLLNHNCEYCQLE